MCGIVGYVGKKQAAPILISGLKSLEYRGYDSSGIAVIDEHNVFLLKKKGKLGNLIECLAQEKISGKVGIGHTRWATHGAPTEVNAHPHYGCNRDFLIVHNGIIENQQSLRAELINQGHKFHSQTDTEVIVHLIEKFYLKDLVQAVCSVLKVLNGSFALGIISRDNPDLLIAARRDSPLIIGLGENENFIASDVPAVLAHTREVIYLEDNEVAMLSKDNVCVYNLSGERIEKRKALISWDVEVAEKAGYEHFMLKEINEQPDVLRRILLNRVKSKRVVFEQIGISEDKLKRVNNIQIVACGTAYHSGFCGKYLFEEFLPVPVSVDVSSEYRYSNQIIEKNRTLTIFVSQSGETADTLACLRKAKQKGALVLSICNVVGSSIARESDGVIYVYAGQEIAVASTKAYIAQLMTFYLLGIYLGRIYGTLDLKKEKEFLEVLSTMPDLMQKILEHSSKVKKIAEEFIKKYNYRLAEQFKFLEDEIGIFKESGKALQFAELCASRSLFTFGRRFGDFPFLYLGRNINYPSALEGALKLKEITYISAEGYAAGEMKHGPIALIDEFPLVVCIVPNSDVYDKMLSNIREIKARKGVVLCIATQGDSLIKGKEYSDYILEIPPVDGLFSPLLVVLPMQFLAYYISVGLGCNVDQPRNLAKSVTVE